MNVSVVMASHDNPSGLKNTIASILNQDFDGFELVIIDDRSTNPETISFLHQLESDYPRKIMVIFKSRNEGLTRALIDGCAVARGEYIARIDAGDIMVPKNRLSIQYDFLSKNSDHVITGGCCEIFDFLNMRIYRTRPILDESEISSKSSTRVVFAHVTVMFRKDSYFKSGGYDPLRYYGQDGELWSRLLQHGRGHNFAKVFARAPMYADSISVGSNNKQQLQRIYNNLRLFLKGDAVIKPLLNILSALAQYFLPIKARIRLRYMMHTEYISKITGEKQLTDY
jgi:glycosyltransferase involved in cell wall biosynthesis